MASFSLKKFIISEDSINNILNLLKNNEYLGKLFLPMEGNIHLHKYYITPQDPHFNQYILCRTTNHL